MADSKKGSETPKDPPPPAKWLDKLIQKPGQEPTAVTIYIGLVRQSPSYPAAYQLYQTLDMASSLHIRTEDVLHTEELAADSSPFGTLGGTKLFVRVGAPVTSVQTSTRTFNAGSAPEDDFDLDIRLGARKPALHKDIPQSVPETACGNACNQPPFSDPDVGGCKTAPMTPLCTQAAPCQPDPDTGFSKCACGNITADCVTIVTCASQCATCHTQCGTCVTCLTQCHTCGVCTHQFTRCHQHTCYTP